jgi:hypothetical protein
LLRCFRREIARSRFFGYGRFFPLLPRFLGMAPRRRFVCRRSFLLSGVGLPVRRAGAFVRHFGISHDVSFKLFYRILPADDPDQEEYDRNDQQDINEPAKSIGSNDAQDP